MSLAELEAAYPELNAVAAERERLQKIDEVAGLFAADLVQAAKYGENPCTAQELAYRAAQLAAEKQSAFLQNWQRDVQQSGTQQVGAAPNEGALEVNGENATPEQRMAAARTEVKALLGKEE